MIKLIAKLLLFVTAAVAAVEVARRTKVVEKLVDRTIAKVIDIQDTQS